MQIGYHASHEQERPSRLLTLASRAETAGFEAVLSSDHLAPWSEQQGESGFAWTWLGAAMATTSVPFGIVTAPGYRYHPAVVAQAIATVGELFPGRFTPALGSGQALNEHVTGERWPGKAERNARLAECADVIGRLLAGEVVDHRGQVEVSEAQVFTRPDVVPPLFAAALSPATARHVARWADGLITVDAPDDTLTAVLDAFREAGGDGKPVHVQKHLSWAEDDERARQVAVERWRANSVPPPVHEDLRRPAQLDAAAQHLGVEAVEGGVLMSADLGRHADAIARLAGFGVDRVVLHDVGPEQERFIDVFGERVLPRARS